jgi:hypothetical protein
LLQPLQKGRSEAQRRQIKRYHFASIGQETYANNCEPDWYRIRAAVSASKLPVNIWQHFSAERIRPLASRNAGEDRKTLLAMEISP